MNFLLAGIFGLASGIFLSSVFIFSWEPIVFAFLLALLFFGATRYYPRIFYRIAAFFFLCIALGMIRASLAIHPPPSIFSDAVGSRVSYTGVVVADPDVRDTTKRITVAVIEEGDATKMLVVVPRTTVAMVGDRVWVSGTLSHPKPFADSGGRVFNYQKYLERDGVYFILNFAYLRVDQTASWYNVSSLFARIKHAFIDGLDRALPEPYASLAAGVVIGGKSGLGDTLQNAFVRSGLVQIIVLSGYNVMIIAEWLMAACAALKISQRLSATAGALAILVFVGIAGASATALRAMIMAFIALFARATGRSYAASRALLVAVGIMLLWNPLYLVFDPGFGLSVTATAGLIWLAPILEKELTWGTVSNQKIGTALPASFWRNAIATTLAAQIAVLPLLLYDTGNLSLVAIPANILTMPIVPLSMAFSALAGIVGMGMGGGVHVVTSIVGLPAYFTNAYLMWVAQKSAAIPFAALTLPAFPVYVTFAAYAVLIYAIAASKRFSTTSQFKLAKKAST